MKLMKGKIFLFNSKNHYCFSFFYQENKLCVVLVMTFMTISQLLTFQFQINEVMYFKCIIGG